MLRSTDPRRAGEVTIPLAAVACAAAAVALAVAMPRAPTATLAWLPISLVLVVAVRRAADTPSLPGALAVVWRRLSWAIAGLAVANVLWVVNAITGRTPFYYSLVGVVYAVVYGWILHAVSALRTGPSTRRARLVHSLDAAVVLVGVLMGGWQLYLRPIAAEHGAPAALLGVAWLVGDGLLVYAALLTVLSSTPAVGRGPLRVLASALLCNVAADVIFAATSPGASDAGKWVANLAWMTGYALIVVAATAQGRAMRRVLAEHPSGALAAVPVLANWEDVNPLPFVALGFGDALFVVVARGELRPGTVPLLFASMALTALVAVRHLTGVRENTRLREERARARVEARFRALIEQASDLVAILDAGLVVRYMSPASERMLGVRPEACIGAPALSLVHEDDRELAEGMLAARSGVDGAVRHAELRLRAAGGSWRPVSATVVNLLHDPAVAGLVVTVRDESARRQAEAALRERDEQLRQVQKMDAVGRLAGGIAHDFNNVLTAIRCSAELLLADIEEGTPAWEDAQEILRSSGRAAELTGQLLTFSRRRVTEADDVDVNAVVADMQRMLDRLLDKGINIRLDLGRLGGPVRIDPGQLQQVVMNLAVNARDAMPDGGTLEIGTRDVEVGRASASVRHAGLTPGRYVALSLRDTGYGMSPDTLGRLFEPFFTTKPKGQGTGLGLSIVYGIVRQCGGQVDVESVPGKGTTFTVLLPLSEPPDRQAPAAREAATPERAEPGYVLVVDDQEPVRTAARRMLERSGLTVRTAADGAEALSLIAALHGPPQLLVTDMMMPVLSGAELVRRLRARYPELPILCMSGYTEDQQFLEELRAGNATFAFLAKPFTSDELLTLAEGLMGVNAG